MAAVDVMADTKMEVEESPVLSEFPAVEDLHSMKVTDLKRELKLHGLSTVGNKSDLIERLSQSPAFKTGDTSIEHEGDASLENEEANSITSGEDELDVSDDRLDFIDTKSSSIIITEKDITEPLCDVSIENDIESTDIESTEIESTSVVTEQKQSLNTEEPTVEKQTVKTSCVQEKKVLLKRTSTTLPVISHTPAEPADNKSSEELIKPKRIVFPSKSLTSEERLQMRAKRFNLSPSSTDHTENSAKTNRGFRRNDPLSEVTSTPDVDVLKKRAARFGQSVSTYMKQIEENERVLKRKLRFGCSAASASLGGLSKADEEEKKKRRVERFGLLV